MKLLIMQLSPKHTEINIKMFLFVLTVLKCAVTLRSQEAVNWYNTLHATLALFTLPYIPLQISSHSVHMNVGSHNLC
jgi:hypothetical protein